MFVDSEYVKGVDFKGDIISKLLIDTAILPFLKCTLMPRNMLLLLSTSKA